MRRLARIVLAGGVSVLSVMAQNWISIGVKGGVPLTEPFADRTFNFVIGSVGLPFGPTPGTVPQTTSTYSGSRYFVLGPTIEVHLPLGFAVEADGLYRPMSVQIKQPTSLPGLAGFLLGGPTIPSRIDTWEFPFLAKYRLPAPVVKPYIEAGPSFRVVSASLAKYMSGTGVSAGIGVESRIGRLRIAPEVRYTHWGNDGVYKAPYHAVSYPNQVEFLAGLAVAPPSSGTIPSRPSYGLSKYLSLGVKGGLPFTTAFIADEFAKVTYPPVRCGDFSPTASCTPVNPSVQTYTASRNYLVGPMIAVHLPRSLSIEANALYAPLSLGAPAGITGYLSLLSIQTLSIQTFNSWQFPVVGKYKFRMPLVSPYLEAGPTFRTASSPLSHYLSTAGVTAGLGVEATAWRLRIAPEVRFVHWNGDAPNAAPFYASRRNQAQFLIGLSY